MPWAAIGYQDDPMLASLIHGFDWKLEAGVSPENMDMEERFGLTLEKAQRLRAIPVRV